MTVFMSGHNQLSDCSFISLRCLLSAGILFGCAFIGNLAAQEKPATTQPPAPNLIAPHPVVPNQVDLANPNQQPAVGRFPHPGLNPETLSLFPNPLQTHSPAPVDPNSQDASDALNDWITEMVLEHIPHTYTDDKLWGETTERWNGIRFRRDNGGLETERRKKTVNHGTWKKYSATLADPDDTFQIELRNMRELPDNQVGLEVHCAAKVLLEARQSKWVKGLQLYSVSATGHATLRLAVAIQLSVGTVPGEFPPDLQFKPVATNAEIKIDEFRIDRISKLGGEFAQQASKAIRKKLDEKIDDKQQDLVDKLNRQFDKKSDEMRISVSDALQSKWTRAAQELFPGPVQQSLSGKPDETNR